jgi:hypothetical protein
MNKLIESFAQIMFFSGNSKSEMTLQRYLIL